MRNSDFPCEEEEFSRFAYPNDYRVADIATQIMIMADAFGIDPTPALGLAERLPALPERAEGWFAVPKSSSSAAMPMRLWRL